MKFIILVDCNEAEFYKMEKIFIDRSVYILKILNSDKLKEYDIIKNSIEKFSRSPQEVMLVKFSGNEAISKELGDKCSEMILTISYNKNNEYYIECPRNIIFNLKKMFEKE